MKKIFLLCVGLLVSVLSFGQVAVQDKPLAGVSERVAKYGVLHVDSVLPLLAEYKDQTAKLDALRKQYVAETERNEMDFKRQFAEYLDGQSTFPPTILMKRQRDLQEAMEKSLAFRRESEQLLEKAEADLRRPLRQRLSQAIATVAKRLRLDYVVNLDSDAMPYVNADLSVDILTPVLEEMQK